MILVYIAGGLAIYVFIASYLTHGALSALEKRKKAELLDAKHKGALSFHSIHLHYYEQDRAARKILLFWPLVVVMWVVEQPILAIVWLGRKAAGR